MFIEDIIRSTDPSPRFEKGLTVAAAMAKLPQRSTETVFVVEGDGRLAGQILRRDMTAATAGVILAEIMREAPQPLGPAVSVVEGYSLMDRHAVDVLPVVDDDGIFLGAVSKAQMAACLSPERIYPVSLEFNQDEDESLAKHVARYRFAGQFLLPHFRVLDAACGSGYGSRILSGSSHSVVGVDVSTESIEFARLNHALRNVEFLCRGIETLDFPDENFDAVITLETLEHIPRPVCETFLKNIDRWVRPGGIVIASAPMLRFRDGKPFVTNPYHINELPRRDLLDTLQQCLSHFTLHFYHQKAGVFLPLLDESDGFLMVVGRKF